jgi:hypothetical protein
MTFLRRALRDQPANNVQGSVKGKAFAMEPLQEATAIQIVFARGDGQFNAASRRMVLC